MLEPNKYDLSSNDCDKELTNLHFREIADTR